MRRRILVVLVAVACQGYPAYTDIDSFFLNWAAEAPSERRRDLSDLLKRMRRTESVSDDQVMRYAFGRLVDLYRGTRDEDVLAVLDETPIDGGFGNEVCGFYQSVLSEESARARYRKRGIEALGRCEGITFRKGDLETMLRVKP